MMTYLFLGPQNEQKEKNISDIKKEWLSTPDSLKFDYAVLHGHKCDPKILKKTLLELPGISQKRVVLLRDFHKLSAYNKGLIEAFLSSSFDHCVLILESSQAGEKDSFVKKVKPYATVVAPAETPKLNVFDITNCMSRKQYAQSLKVLSQLIEEGQHPLQIMGGLVWFWGRTKNRLSQARYEKGLKCLQEADLDIKRSRLKPDYAMERLVVRLCAIIG